MSIGFEDGLAFQGFMGQNPDVVSRCIEIVVGQLRKVLRLIVLRRRNQVGFAIVVPKSVISRDISPSGRKLRRNLKGPVGERLIATPARAAE